MQKKTNDLQDAVKKNPPDIKLLQLVLQGSISTQVYYGYYCVGMQEPIVKLIQHNLPNIFYNSTNSLLIVMFALEWTLRHIYMHTAFTILQNGKIWLRTNI